MYYSQEQIERANQVNLEDFLRRQGETLIRSGKEYRWKCHDSLTVHGNKWFRHSQSKGGYPVAFVMEFYGKSFPEAVQLLIGESGTEGTETRSSPAPEFRLPTRNLTNKRVTAYLTGQRCIALTVVETFLASGNLYEEANHHNAVFVGRDKNGLPRYAHCRDIQSQLRKDVAGSDKSYGFQYQGKGDQLFVFEAPIDLMSFICLYPKGWSNRNYLSLGGVSGKPLERFLSERSDIRHIYLCLDNDAAGNAACIRLAESLPSQLNAIRLLPSRKDWNEVLQHRSEIPDSQFIAQTSTLKKAEKEAPVPVIRMSEVEETAINWLWFPYIPFGKLTIIQGNPGEGKTFFAMQLAAACTNRKSLPNMAELNPFPVIYQTAEDGLGDTVKPRLRAAGADLDRVLVIDDGDDPLTLSDERLEKAIKQNDAKLLIIDPIQAFLGANVDMNRANEVRPIFRKLGDVAQNTGCAIVLIGHLNKATGVQSTYRGLGSIDIAAVVRSLLFIGKVKNDPSTRVLVQEKNSLAPPGKSLAFSLGTETGFQWIGEYDITADELLSSAEHTETKAEQAEKLILEMLEAEEKVFSCKIDQAAAELGISARTVRQAKRNLHKRLHMEREGTQWVLSIRKNEAADL